MRFMRSEIRQPSHKPPEVESTAQLELACLHSIQMGKQCSTCKPQLEIHDSAVLEKAFDALHNKTPDMGPSPPVISFLEDTLQLSTSSSRYVPVTWFYVVVCSSTAFLRLQLTCCTVAGRIVFMRWAVFSRRWLSFLWMLWNTGIFGISSQAWFFLSNSKLQGKLTASTLCKYGQLCLQWTASPQQGVRLTLQDVRRESWIFTVPLLQLLRRVQEFGREKSSNPESHKVSCIQFISVLC